MSGPKLAWCLSVLLEQGFDKRQITILIEAMVDTLLIQRKERLRASLGETFTPQETMTLDALRSHLTDPRSQSDAVRSRAATSPVTSDACDRKAALRSERNRRYYERGKAGLVGRGG